MIAPEGAKAVEAVEAVKAEDFSDAYLVSTHSSDVLSPEATNSKDVVKG